MTTSRRGLIAALIATVTALIASVAFTLAVVRPWNADAWWSGGPNASGHGYLMGPGMMGAAGTCMPMGLWLAGDGPVTTIDAARVQADRAGQPRALTAGEVMAFTGNFYVILTDTQGAPATEVLVDPATGSVCVEPGPATLWNTSWGIHPAGPPSGSAPLSPEQASTAAQRWLDAHVQGSTAHEPVAFPGYYTLDYDVAGRVAGMLSVRDSDARIWPHTWHGTFIAEDEGTA